MTCDWGDVSIGTFSNVTVPGVVGATSRTLANHVPKTNPSANAALATTGSHVAQICFSSLTRKSSIL
jgi:hypothetical protein